MAKSVPQFTEPVYLREKLIEAQSELAITHTAQMLGPLTGYLRMISLSLI